MQGWNVLRRIIILGLLSLVSLLLGSSLMKMPSQASSLATPIKRSSSAIAITDDGQFLLAVNPDSNSLTVIDTTSQHVIGEIQVGVDPRTVTVDNTSGRAYVACRGSDQVSVIDLSQGQVIENIPVGYRPHGVIVSPDGSRLYVSEQGNDQLNIIDAGTYESLASIPLADRPTGLAIGNGGSSLYITHLLSNKITILDYLPVNIYLPLIKLSDSGNASVNQDAEAKSQNESTTLPPGYHLSYLTLWPDSNLVLSFIIAPDEQKAYIPHTRSNTSNQALTFDTTVFPLVSMVDVKTRTHLIGQQLDLGTLDPPGVGLPFDAVVSVDGTELWVVNAASNDITVLNLATRSLQAHIEVGDNPRGIVMSPDGAQAYVNNTLAGTVSVLDTSSYSVSNVIQTTRIPLPPLLLRGKILFHTSDDPRMSNAQWISCNTCHFEGEHDARTWFFGFAGPRNTTSLLGMIETYPLRWSGEWNESADSEFANRKENFGSGLIDDAMNCLLSPPDCVHAPPNQGLSHDLDALAAFLDSLQVPISPNHIRNEPLNEAELRGQALFLDPALGCVTCHPPPHFTDHLSHDVGTATLDERIGPTYDTPTLRGLYDSAPYFHDGSAATIYAALTRPSPASEHDLSAVLTETQIQDLIAYLLALPYE